MQPHLQGDLSLQPRVYDYSLDWRFLLPVADPRNLHLLFEENTEFNQTLERVGIQVSQQLSFSELRDGKNHNLPSVVMPFGLSVGWAGPNREEQVEFYITVRRSMASGGNLLIGFDNAWTLRAGAHTNYYSCRPDRVADQLRQAGFRSIKMFGAMPNLNIPEYIFDIEPRTVHFALRNRFRRKPKVILALRALAGTVGWLRISNFLPCYFAVATA